MLENQNLTILPDKLREFPNLSNLMLRGNKLRTLSNILDNSTNLVLLSPILLLLNKFAFLYNIKNEFL